MDKKSEKEDKRNRSLGQSSSAKSQQDSRLKEKYNLTDEEIKQIPTMTEIKKFFKDFPDEFFAEEPNHDLKE